MDRKNISALTALSFAAAVALSACGGGGGGGNSSGAAAPASGASNPTTSTPTNLTSPQYAATSAQLAAFNLLNQQRQQCGFPALQENDALDKAAQAHAQYSATNNLISDNEVASNAGFTGVTYADRAVHFGYPQSVYSGGVTGGFYTNAKWTEQQYGEQVIWGYLAGVYHIAVAAWPVTGVGIGHVETAFDGFPQVWSSLSIGDLKPMTANAPLTFPCQGTSGVAYKTGAETPTPPNVSGTWGTPIAVAGNPSDTVILTSGTLTDTAGNVVSLQLLYSANDPNKLLPAFEGVAYSATPLSPNMPYTAAISGTINGKPFSRTFTFTTGNIVA